MTNSVANSYEAASRLGFKIEQRGDVAVIVFEKGCRPANDEEVALWNALQVQLAYGPNGVDWKRRYEDECAIVDRCWKALGIPLSYDEVKPLTIYDYIEGAFKALRTLQGYNEHIRDRLINFRPEDHLTIIKLGLTGWRDTRSDATHGGISNAE